MGEARKRQQADKALLVNDPLCIYCGAKADTVDHCPPRCFFVRRHWPEGFVYPACTKCNSEARLDEQALAVLIRIRTDEQYPDGTIDEFGRLMKAVANNSPHIMEEWKVGTRGVTQKRAMRKLFGKDAGDNLRLRGWGAMNLGSQTRAMIKRFMVRLAQALFYHHTQKVFQGSIFTQHVSLVQTDNPQGFLEAALSIAPLLSETFRSKKWLGEQFSYRYNVSPEHKMLYAVAQFSEQFVFQLTAMGPEIAERFLTEKDKPVDRLGEITSVIHAER